MLWLPDELTAPATGRLSGRAAVVDVLRATSTVATALAHGAEGVVPVPDVEEARALARRLELDGHRRPLLGGERQAVRPAGFDLGNSPLEYGPEIVAGRLVVLTTTNGTRAFSLCAQAMGLPTGWLAPAAGTDGEIAAAALVNGPAVAQWLAEAPDRRVTVVCAGTEGRVSLEDVACAGLLAQRVAAAWGNDVTLTDGAQAAIQLYQAHADELAALLRSTRHGARLLQLGFAEDLAYCARVGLHRVVPVYRSGRLVPLARKEA